MFGLEPCWNSEQKPRVPRHVNIPIFHAPCCGRCDESLSCGLTSLCLAGCGKTEAYRYKLTLAVDTPQLVGRVVGEAVTSRLFADSEWRITPSANPPYGLFGAGLTRSNVNADRGQDGQSRAGHGGDRRDQDRHASADRICDVAVAAVSA
jgi:hypothetical protein